MLEKFRIVLLFVGAVVVGGCATAESRTEPLPRLDMAEIREMLDCPLDSTPVCTERIGKPYHCFCADRDALQRILEPDKY